MQVKKSPIPENIMVLEEGEEIKSVVGYEDSYLVSSYGRVWSCPKPLNSFAKTRGSWLSVKFCRENNRHDSLTVLLSKRGTRTKSFRVHRLVAQAFLYDGVAEDFINYRVTHKDRNLGNNREDNLKVTRKGSIKRIRRSKPKVDHNKILPKTKKEDTIYYDIKCLKCQEVFPSRDKINNRVCKTCKRHKEGLSGAI